jgi:response regulator RpfG family c-di-GMP phosphodiesterase
MSGVEFLGHVRKLYPDIVRILATGTHDPDAIAEAVNEAGIQKFLSKDWDDQRLRAEVREVYRKHFLSEDTKAPLPGARSI